MKRQLIMGKIKPKEAKRLRPVVIDGMNIGYCHGQDNFFSLMGILIVTQYFLKKGHRVKIFLPQYVLSMTKLTSQDRSIISNLKTFGIIVLTPSKYDDDSYILDWAHLRNAVVITRDKFRDFKSKNFKIPKCLEPTFVGDTLLWPRHPYGKYSNISLGEFLSF